MKKIKNEFEEILKPNLVSIDELNEINFGDMCESFGDAKQKVYDLICKHTAHLPISDNIKVDYINKINYIFTKDLYDFDNPEKRGIESYSDLHYIRNRHINFIKLVLNNFPDVVSNSITGGNINEIISLMKRFNKEFEILKIKKEHGIIAENEGNPFDDYKNDIFKNEIANYNITEKRNGNFENSQTNSVDKSTKPDFIPQTDNLKNWILTDYITKFTEIEKELFSRGYINDSYKWMKHKTELAEFICVLIDYKYFKPIVQGKKIQAFHKKQFISERYGFGKTGLSETWKKTKPKIEHAKIPFSWIEKPE